MLLMPKKAALLAGKALSIPAVTDVFQARLRTGSGAARTESVGWRPDLVWSKARSAGSTTQTHRLFDTNRGAGSFLSTPTTAAPATDAQTLTSFNSDGYSLGTASGINASGATYVDWLFKDAPGFFRRGRVTKVSGQSLAIDLSSLGAIAFFVFKSLSAAGDFQTYYRGMAANRRLFLNSIASEGNLANQYSVAGTTVTLDPTATDALAAGDYEYYALAHGDLSQCGIFTTGSSSNNILPWDPGFLIVKNVSGSGDWQMFDVARGFTSTGGKMISASLTDAEISSTAVQAIPSGFKYNRGGSGTMTSIYLAIKNAT